MIAHWIDLLLGRHSTEAILASFTKAEARLKRFVERETERVNHHVHLREELKDTIDVLEKGIAEIEASVHTANNARAKLQAFFS